MEEVEKMIQGKNLNAPRITKEEMVNEIFSVHYFTAADGVYGSGTKTNPPNESLTLLTFCVITMRNGFTVTGESACASPENFDAEIGRKIAYDNAFNKLWPLFGFMLKEALHQARLDEL